MGNECNEQILCTLTGFPAAKGRSSHDGYGLVVAEAQAASGVSYAKLLMFIPVMFFEIIETY